MAALVEERPYPVFGESANAMNYQRTPNVTGISLVPSPTVVVPNPFGCVVTAGVSTSRYRASAKSFMFPPPGL